MFSTTAVLTLAVGLGATGTMFALVRGVLLKPLPFDDSRALVAVRHSAPGLHLPSLGMSPATYFFYRDSSHAFEEFGIWDSGSATVTNRGVSERVEVLTVTDGVLTALRVQPNVGRRFTPADDSPGLPRRVIISHAYWRRSLGQAPDVLGRWLTVDGEPVEIIGVLPANFTFLDKHPDLFLPFRLNRNDAVVGGFRYNGLGRLRSGITIDAARKELARLTPRVIERYQMPPGYNRQTFDEMQLGVLVGPLLEDFTGSMSKSMLMLLGCIAGVLVIGCLNVAQLGLLRAEERAPDSALRLALGASRTDVAADALTESALIAGCAVVIALAISFGAVAILRHVSLTVLPRLSEVSMDGFSIAFVIVSGCGACALIALPSMIRRANTDAVSFAPRTVGLSRDRQAVSRLLATVEIAGTVIVLVITGVMGQTFVALNRTDLGFAAPRDLLTLRIVVPASIIKEPEAVVRTYQSIAQHFESLSGVDAVGLSSSIAMDGAASPNVVWVDGFPGEDGRLLHRFKRVGPNYFETMGQGVLAGRTLTWNDCIEVRPVAIVSASFARKYWNDASSAIGKHIRQSPEDVGRMIVGVVSDVRDDGPAKPPPSTVYWPLLTVSATGEVRPARFMAYALRSPRATSIGFVDDVRRALAEANPNLAMSDPQTIAAMQRQWLAPRAMSTTILVSAAVVSVVLALIGVYGVVARAVSRRTSEVGVRVALGATRVDVLVLFLREASKVTIVGVALGLVGAFIATNALSTTIAELTPIDWRIYALMGGFAAIVSTVATCVPAARAARLDPMQALRAPG
jgi:putative ABC transport system permease protein